MGQVITRDVKLEPDNYNDISIKCKEIIKQLNLHCKDVGLLRMCYHGDFVKTDTEMYFYISCVLLENTNVDDESINNCNTILTLTVKTLDNKVIINPHIDKYITNITQICSNLCMAIPNCTSLNYNLISLQSTLKVPHPVGYTIMLYPIIN